MDHQGSGSPVLLNPSLLKYVTEYKSQLSTRITDIQLGRKVKFQIKYLKSRDSKVFFNKTL